MNYNTKKYINKKHIFHSESSQLSLRHNGYKT